MAHDDVKNVQNQQPGKDNPTQGSKQDSSKQQGGQVENQPGRPLIPKDVQGTEKREETQKTGTGKH